MQKTIAKITPRPAQPHMVGDGFRVFGFIPTAVERRAISPFLVLDFNPEYDFGPSEIPKGFGTHPHKGFETVTIAYKGSVQHADSSGGGGIINEGDVQWMTAGAGILHKEFHEEQFSKTGGPFEMVQLWVNLPAKNKNAQPRYQSVGKQRMGKYEIPDNGGTVNVIAGTFNGVKGPAQTYTPIVLSDIRLKAGGTVTTQLPENYNAALLIIKGNVEVNGSQAAEHSFVQFNNEGETVTIKAAENAIMLLLGGEPIEEPIAAYGPFVMNTQEEIYEAIEDFRNGKFGTL
ncbi:short-chain dehydrogenase [Niabella ginsenosidivorans]|uniref:Short-chain dehydrogenase n=1 Tax=Niabella ginsenosidivorans TaxID=1176587 RepID=A0A1A9I7W3_9BACT|nr:pirin family protein [Niabella ginsenosidivorans]ANH82781.1 short-chain dehydrogenase [Niabella ginsenosidivorans]